mmetsp:Transcript_31402/g.57684  ORF Transcript_31402/g.57684 Transcript_31402/m.57684 type:complete len:144 (+) Transcript_31402:74-505(+)
MWHLNIPIMRRLGHVAEHEREAVLSLARTWWGFAENLPPALREAKEALIPKPMVVPESAISLRRETAAKQLQHRTHSASSQQVAIPSPMASVDVGFEVMLASRASHAASHNRSTVPGLTIEDGVVRHQPPPATGAAQIFKLIG